MYFQTMMHHLHQEKRCLNLIHFSFQLLLSGLKKQLIALTLITVILAYSLEEAKIYYMHFRGLIAKVLSPCLISMEIQNGSMLQKMVTIIKITLLTTNL